MNSDQLLAFLREQLQQSGHPDIKPEAVTPLDTPGIRVDCTDGSRFFTRICHAGKAGANPTQPVWATPASGGGARR